MGVSKTIMGKKKHYGKGFSSDHKIQQVLRKLDHYTLHTSFKKSEVERNAFRWDILSHTVYMPRSSPLLSNVTLTLALTYLSLLNELPSKGTTLGTSERHGEATLRQV